MQLANQLASRLRSDWPYSAARVPVFYGWPIALLSTLGFLMSIPGQTMGMAVFADPFIEATGLSRTQLSTAYLFGTLSSALLLTRAGRWYDQHGARIMIVSASLGLGVTLVFLCVADRLAWVLANSLSVAPALFSFPLLVLGYFGVRFAGQGVLTSASRNVLLVWFRRRRGFVSGLRGVFVSLGFSISPLLIALLMDAAGWRGALLWMAAAVGVGFALLAAFLAAGSVGALPRVGVMGLVVFCMVMGRTCAMAVNRWADAKLDQSNPRTSNRAIPAGKLTTRYMLNAALLSSARGRHRWLACSCRGYQKCTGTQRHDKRHPAHHRHLP